MDTCNLEIHRTHTQCNSSEFCEMARHREIHNLGDDDMYDYDDDYEYYGEDFSSAPPSKMNVGGGSANSGGGKKRRKKKQTGGAKQEEKIDVPKAKVIASKGKEQQKDTNPESTETVSEKLKGISIKSDSKIEIEKNESPALSDKTTAKKRVIEEIAKQHKEPDINLVVIGHVDSGKSTLMGHLLYKLGTVNKKQMRKFEHESKHMGKGSFAYAWVLDEQGEERERGITVDIAMKSFYTENRKVTLLDAPGHRDFIGNMIAGAAQADLAILVIDCVKGAFEAGFDHGGQTREHALLAKSLGISQLIVAVNKMDQWQWERERFIDILDKLTPYLTQIGFKETELHFIPISGLEGVNLVERVSHIKWYEGPCLIECIDAIEPPMRSVDKPLRFCVSGVNQVGGSMHLSGRVETGYFQTGDKLLVLPSEQTGVVRSIILHEETAQGAMAGSNVEVVLAKIDPTDLCVGCVLCPVQSPIPVARLITAKIAVLNTERAITRGYSVELYYQTVCEPATVSNLISQVHKASGEVIKQRPKALHKNTSGVVEIETVRAICVETFEDCKELGRIALRSNGKTVAVGIILNLTKREDI